MSWWARDGRSAQIKNVLWEIAGAKKIAWSLWLLESNVENVMLPVTKSWLTCSVAKLGLLFAAPWLQHTRLPCPSLSPGVCSNSCTLSQWCHPTILCSPLLFMPSIFPNISVFSKESALHIRWPKYWSLSFNISPSNEYLGLIPSEFTGVISLLSKGLSRVFSSSTVWKHQFFGAQPSLWFNSHIHTWLLEKP